MIILFDSNATDFTTLGLGVLKDAISCRVTEGLNGGFETEMEYPMTGSHYSDIRLERIILVKPNMYDLPQPFRIYEISKPINGIVTISAAHISYDMTGFTIKPFRGDDLDSVLTAIKNNSILPDKNPFNIIRYDDPGSYKHKNNVELKEPMISSSPINMRSLLAGHEGSILDIFKGEYYFDKYNVYLMNKRGKDRGIQIRYGKNMIDVEQDINSDKMFTGIFPFFHKTITETVTANRQYFNTLKINDGKKELHHDWLTSTKLEALDPYIPVFEDGVPMQIVSDNQTYNGKIVMFRRARELSTPINSYINTEEDIEQFGEEWLKDGSDEVIEPSRTVRYIVKTEGDFLDKIYFWSGKVFIEDPSYILKLVEINESGTVNNSNWFTTSPISGNDYVIYRVISEGDFENKNYIWNSSSNKYELYGSDGFYFYPNPIPTPPFSKVETVSIELDVYRDLTQKYIKNNDTNEYIEQEIYSEPTYPEGVMYVPGFETHDPQRILTLDLSGEFEEIPDEESVRLKAIDYMEKNKLREVNSSINVSFLRLSDSEEYKQFKQLETVKLGDTVKIIYEDLGIEDSLQVISTEYDPLSDKYEEIELGDKSAKLTDNVLTRGDSITALRNDANFTDEMTTQKLVAEVVKAYNLEAEKATITEAQIESLIAQDVKIPGMLAASYAEIDKIVANRMTAENAEIKNVLKAGELEVKGKITATSGDIGGSKIQNGKMIVSTSISIQGSDDGAEVHFIVDEFGNVQANSLSITGGNIKIGNNFEVTNDGKMTAKEANIEGDVNIKSGAIKIGDNFEVTNDGKMKASEAEIDGKITVNNGSITIGGTEENPNFVVDEEGNLTGKGKIDFVMFSVEDGVVTANQFIMGTSGNDASVTINKDGKLTATNAQIIGDVETEHIKSKKLTIQDAINIDLLTDSGTILTQTVTNTVTTKIEQPDGHELYIHIKVNKDLWYDQTLSVRFTYTTYSNGRSTNRTVTKSFILRADTSGYPTSGYSGDRYDPSTKTYKLFTGIYMLPHDGSITGAYINTRTPSSWSETQGVPGYTSAQIDTHFSPKTSNLDLGKNNRRWKSSYVVQPTFTNQPIISSDRRLKKDVEYDISRYDKLFDGLQPTAYKLVDGESGRTHLGLIAQDLQALLESCDIDSKDFAGFIKKFKDPDILLKKKLEDLTEDDYEYGIRYSELQALQIRQIQLLKKEIKELKEKIK